jgi:hypothetical protein
VADLRSSLLFESCETISITSLGEVIIHLDTCPVCNAVDEVVRLLCYRLMSILLVFRLAGSEEDLFYDAPTSPVGDRQFFSDMPGSLQGADSVRRRGLVKKEPQKNMTELLLRFEINEVR